MRKSVLIPSIIGIIILVIGVVVGVVMVQRQQSANVGAQPMIEPLQIEVSNITDESFTVSWITQASVTGIVAYGEDQSVSFLARDKRDIFDQRLGQYKTHWVQVVGLKPDTAYYFAIQSGGERYTNNGELYAITTANEVSIAEGVTAFGKVETLDGSDAEGVIVLASGENLAVQSTITDIQGNWSINFANARTTSLVNLAQVTPSSILELRAQGESLGNSLMKLKGNQLTPVPTLRLGKTYDFVSLANNSQVTSGEGEPKSQFIFAPELGAQNSQQPDGVTIWSPLENEAISTSQPLFIGTAPVSTNLNLVIDEGTDREIEGTSISDVRSNWQWSVNQPLSNGQHSITASYTDDSGVEFQMSRIFSVVSSDARPAFESSPSATTGTPTPTAVVSTPTPTRPTPTPIRAEVSPTATATPTQRPLEVSPTATMTTSPTATGVMIEVSPTTTPTPAVLPQAGASMPTLVLSGAGVLLVIMAGVLLL